MTPLALAIALLLAAAPAGPRLEGLKVTNGASPFAGDARLLTTVSPNRDGFRDRAVVSFRLDRRATVFVQAVRTDTIRAGRPAGAVVWSTRLRLTAGLHRIAWRPHPATPPRTYILRLTVTDARGRTRIYGAYRPSRGRRDAPVVRVQTVEAGFTRRSYAPGDLAEVSIASDARSLRLQVFTYGNQTHPTPEDLRTSGRAMTPAARIDWTRRRSAPARLRIVRAGEWVSGLYFLRVTAGDGRVAYAPFIVRPRRLGTSRVAVVLATNTWQAYNFADADGDGWGDSWYVDDAKRRIDLERPYLDFGVPFRFKDWDLSFVAWLHATGKRADFLSDDDLERASGDELARAYDLIVFPGHEEYVTAHAYDVVRRYRDLGGNLAFLAANNVFWKVRREGQTLVKERLWRELGRPEAALVGVQYVGSDGGRRRGPYLVQGAAAAPWAFAGTGLRDGDELGGGYGIEIDARTAASPSGTLLLAAIPNLMGPGRSAEMTYYETDAGAKVFAAGTINFAASLDRPEVSKLVENLWARLSQP